MRCTLGFKFLNLIINPSLLAKLRPEILNASPGWPFATAVTTVTTEVTKPLAGKGPSVNDVTRVL